MNGPTITREVMMKLSAKADPSLTQSYKEMARSAKEAAQFESDYQALAKGRGPLYETIAQQRKKLANAGINELSEEEKYQRLFRQRIKDMQTAARLKKDLAKAGYGENAKELNGVEKFSAGLAKAALGLSAFATGLHAADQGIRAYYASLERGAFNQEAFERNMRRNLRNVPIVGEQIYHQKRENTSRAAYHAWRLRTFGNTSSFSGRISSATGARIPTYKEWAQREGVSRCREGLPRLPQRTERRTGSCPRPDGDGDATPPGRPGDGDGGAAGRA